jgi:hypothetical protein
VQKVTADIADSLGLKQAEGALIAELRSNAAPKPNVLVDRLLPRRRRRHASVSGGWKCLSGRIYAPPGPGFSTNALDPCNSPAFLGFVYSCRGEPLNDTAFRISSYFGYNYQFANQWLAGIKGECGLRQQDHYMMIMPPSCALISTALPREKKRLQIPPHWLGAPSGFESNELLI